MIGMPLNMPLPPGAVYLSTEEAIEAIVTGDHPEAESGSVELDTTLIGYVQGEMVRVIRLESGVLAFALNTNRVEIL